MMPRKPIITLLFAMLLAAPPAAAETATIAVVAPKDGPLSIIGRQVFDGARFAAMASGIEVVEIGESCEEDGDEGIAAAVKEANARAVIGFLCTEGLEKALPQFAEAGIPALTLSVRSGIVMEDALKKKWPLFRLAPGPNAEAEKAVEVMTRDWKAEPFALIDDGTIRARELVEAIRGKLELVGMKPIFVDTFRPAQEQQIALVRRLAKSGATHVFVGGDRTDTAIIARDAKAEEVPLAVLGGEAMIAADEPVPMPQGVQAIAIPDYETLQEGTAVAAQMRENDIVAEGYALPAYAAVTIAAEALKTAESENRPVAEALIDHSFQTVIGPVGFTAQHELRDNPYRLLEWREGGFVPVPPASAND
ncbi:ABC transporter substrate-binding protein [Sinorhizobium sp. BG8]|uniref:ABC transporter substrate-binding protein n=1 Tax=Sinorhizobium sp. BG8 TaxID=2613773 RepID=UPI00193D46A1|nr:ABC transporter substrate-binding protein [Sinorhizobium sp. BG8]QRM55625.1 ABC transporter substrate-binding protein [Sinorhizobium sp. BG8]